MSTNVQTITASGVNPPADEDSTSYVVRAGDTLSAIAEAHGVTLEALEDANPGILHPDLIRPGQRLEIPSARGEAQSRPSSYTVRAGDTLSGIGGRLGADWRLLAQLNHVEDPRHLQIGATLRVPAPTMHATGRSTTSTPAGGVAGHAGASAALVKPGTVSSRGIPDTSNLTQAQKVQLYSAYIDTYGDARAKADLAAGRQVILGLRHDTNTHANGGGGAYDDRIVVVSRSGVREFVGNTEPSARYEGRFGSPAPDGRLALGRIAEGSDRFTRDYSPHLGDVLRPTGSVKIDRDTSHDGAFDGPNTRSISTDESFLFHAGGSTITGSAGCQTLRPADFSRFWSDLNQGQKQFSYVLVEADRHGVKSAPTAQPSASRQPEASARTGAGMSVETALSLTGAAPGSPQARWIAQALPAAQAVQQRYGVPVSVTLAQGALESGWGRSAPNNNFFGVKGSGSTQTTTEYVNGQRVTVRDSFRGYSGLEQSAMDYGRFLTTNARYASAFDFRADPFAFVGEVARAGYATDPNYAVEVQSIIRSNHLDRLDAR